MVTDLSRETLALNSVERDRRMETQGEEANRRGTDGQRTSADF